MTRHRGLSSRDRPLVDALLRSLPAFTDAERDVALELVDDALAHPDRDDYRFILAFPDDRDVLAGYLCYGRTPMTRATYDLYWLATSPDLARSGIARGLVASMEAEITEAGGGIIRVETGSREGHGAAVHFYDATGFGRSGTIADFYAPGDDLIIFTRRVAGPSSAPGDTLDDAALYDAATGYRDYASERDFLLSCASRFGARDVRSVIAWACGTGRHLLAFADAGIEATGIDPSEAMVAFSDRLVSARNNGAPPVRVVRAALDDRPVVPLADLSFVPLSSIHQLTTPDAIARHLASAAALLREGGLHVIEATHPADVTASGVHKTEWTEVRGSDVIDARFRMHIDKLTPERTVPVTLEVVCSPAKKSADKRQQKLRQEDTWFIPDLAGWREIIARVPDLELVATLGDFNPDVSFDHSAAWRLILVLKRR